MSTYTDIAETEANTAQETMRQLGVLEVENVTLEVHGIAPDRTREGETAGTYVAIVRLTSGHTAARDGDTKEDAIRCTTRAAIAKALRL